MREEFEDGKLVRALHLTGGFSSVLSKIKSKDDIPQQPTIEQVITKLSESKITDPNLMRYAKKEAEKYFQQGQTFKAASAYLAVNDVKSAIQILVRTNELIIAYQLAK